MYPSVRFLRVGVLIVVLISEMCVESGKVSKDVIGFPETELNHKLKNSQNRVPVYLPSVCAENEWYYPGDQVDDWICDCSPAHLYHPASNGCWPAWRQGPCGEGQMLILPPNTVLPSCVKNPCVIDGLVQWGVYCQSLHSTEPCGQFYPKSAALGVNATTLQVECMTTAVLSRFSDTVETGETTLPSCPPGSKRSVSGKCMPM